MESMAHHFFYKKKKKIVKSVFVKTILKSKNKCHSLSLMSRESLNAVYWIDSIDSV